MFRVRVFVGAGPAGNPPGLPRVGGGGGTWRGSAVKAGRFLDVVPVADHPAAIRAWRETGPGDKRVDIATFAGRWVRDNGRLRDKPPPPRGEWDVVVSDPPWPLEVLPQIWGGEVGATYSSLSLDEIRAIRPPVANPGWLFLWCLDRWLWDARQMILDWGLEYGGMMVWQKNGGVQRPDGWQGNGEYVLFGSPDIAASLVLVGRAGNPRYGDTRRFFSVNPPLSASPDERQSWARRGHSQKPDGFFALVERVCGPVARLEMFARGPRPGWDVWGDQSGGGAVGVVGSG